MDLTKRLSAHVVAKETRCRCQQCDLYEVSPTVLEIFEAIRAEMNRRRAAAGLPERGIQISSGVRCLAYQHTLKKRGLTDTVNSLHVPKLGTHVGSALDLLVPFGMSREEFFDVCNTALKGFPNAGLGRYWRRGFAHVDDGRGYDYPRRFDKR
jgi:uncharacterized protein YcbK (DUF882 family)